ncbi:thioredoxin, mitochondrial-like [Macrosteles quadrilineatus]|uniref:thioredoxin, mitochondrial-like n=1 Tax=Macrosteles quadrilineatus TaxID=74068 RepID=UPI0023E30EB6|nr:thioredoxin, mitochondrial-like [Macrosteles quadrilineatus]XP_054286714.1 thioredoxin, mitochondrial-like [Macrosteles quadrilineatus]
MQTTKLFSCINLIGRSVSSPFAHQLCRITTSSKATKSFKIQDEKDFDERVKKSKTPVIVDFFATWCNPCKALTPRIESVVAEKEGKIVLAKVDIDEQEKLADDYDIKTVPVLLVMRNGKVEDKLVGLQDTDKLHKFIDQVIAK